MKAVRGSVNTLFSYGFRPLFLLATLHALLSIVFWTAAWSGALAVDWQRIPTYWHGHEMIMGLAAAAIGGFLLTAVPNWTNRPPITGWPLALLCAFWLTGRLSLHSTLLSALADTGYWLLLWLLVAREIVAARNRRNYKVLAVLALILLSDAGFHLAELRFPDLQQRFLWAQIWLVILLINTIGGRVIPAFTGNWLRRQAAPQTLTARELPPAFNRIDLAAIVTLLLFALATLLPVPASAAVALGSLAFLLQLWRLGRWKFHRTASEPLVWMMHLSYLWIPLGIGLWTAAIAGFAPVSAAVHALTVGAISSMIISIASRAALGHTNRPLASHPLLTACIVLLSLAAVLRVTASISGWMGLLHVSAAAWIIAFLCFAIRYVPVLLLPADR